jgi:hypothetical protein
VLALVATWLHLRAGYVFPRPWPDEAHFLTPAMALARDGRLAVPELNAGQGLFWMPSGYYVAQLPLLLVRVDALAGARLLSLVGVVTFAVCAGLTAVRAGVTRTVAFTAVLAWLCMPRVVAIANIARMEGVVLGLAGACLALVARDRWPWAVVVSLLGPLVHPVGIVLPVAVIGAAAVRPGIARRSDGPTRRWSRAEMIALAAVVVLTLAQLAYFAVHADVAADHLRFQITRKAGRPITVRWWQLALLLSAAAGGLAATLRWRRSAPALVALWVAMALAGGFVLIDVVGREMWYEHLGRETAVLLLGLAAAAALTRTTVAVTVAYAAAVVTTLALVFASGVALRNTLVDGWYGMTPAAGTRAEWRAFTASATAELSRLDSAATQEQLVVVDPLSGFAQEVFARDWQRLRFVQPTPATPMDTLQADYVLTTPGVPFTTDALVEQWGALEPVVDVASPSGTFRMQLIANPG